MVYETFKDDAPFLQFLPDLTVGRKLPDRKWVMGVFTSLKPHFMKCCVENADNLRMKQKLPKETDGEIEITSEYL